MLIACAVGITPIKYIVRVQKSGIVRDILVALSEVAVLPRKEESKEAEEKGNKLGAPSVDDVERLELIVDDLAIVDIKAQFVANLIAVNLTHSHHYVFSWLTCPFAL